jgi:hypothetical protein
MTSVQETLKIIKTRCFYMSNLRFNDLYALLLRPETFLFIPVSPNYHLLQRNSDWSEASFQFVGIHTNYMHLQEHPISFGPWTRFDTLLIRTSNSLLIIGILISLPIHNTIHRFKYWTLVNLYLTLSQPYYLEEAQ